MTLDSRLLKCIVTRQNILLHGAGGTGKSYTLREIVMFCRSKGIFYGLTSTTGVSAVNLSDHTRMIAAATMHSHLGLPIEYNKDPRVMYQIISRKKQADRWRILEVLIIDEVSMLSAELFEAMEYTARKIRDNDAPFGGITLVVSGDFLQLSPVKAAWVFTSKKWHDMNFITFEFSSPKRYNDMNWFSLLMRAREGIMTQDDISLLKTREGIPVKDVGGVLPTLLFSKKADADSHNLAELQNLPLPEMTYQALDVLTDNRGEIIHDAIVLATAKIRLDETIRPTIRLRKGSQVMLKANLDIDLGLANGSRGIVLDIEPKRCFVRFYNGQEKWIVPYTWSIDVSDAIINPDVRKCIAIRHHIPLILAFASTIHSIQGCTLDTAVMDIGFSIFMPAQAYVSLSRVRSIDGLYLKSFQQRRMYCDKSALAYVKHIRDNALIYGDEGTPLTFRVEIVYLS